MKKLAWFLFWVLGFTWGSSFLLIRISVHEINPFELVFIRVSIAAIGLLIIVHLRGLSIPRKPSALFPLLLIGIGNPAIPFLLISWGETIIDSSVASILQSTASLFTLVIAHFFFDDERLTPQRVGGMILGFAGVTILFGLNFEDGAFAINGLLGQLSIVVASIFYAITGTYSRFILKDKTVKPIVVAAVSMSSATIIMGAAMLLAPVFGGPAPSFFVGISQQAKLAAIALGVFNTLFAYTLLYFIIEAIGASRASMVTYIVPVIGLILGVTFANEPFGWNLVIGAILIISGIGVVNLPVHTGKSKLTAIEETA